MGKEIGETIAEPEVAIDRSDEAEEIADRLPELQRAHDRIIRGMAAGRQQMVFDAFWREGELALMFGGPGTGKSLLAMQIANALACEGDIPWFQMDTQPANTLYVDLSMSDRQFASRNSYAGRGGKISPWPTSRRLFCDRPPEDTDLVEWLGEHIKCSRIKYIIIDDLSSMINTCDGTRETLKVMRGLRKLRERFDVSILVVMQSDEPREGSAISEKGLGRQRALCRLADGVFGIGRQAGSSGRIYLMQTRSRNSELVWTAGNGVLGTIKESHGCVQIAFDMRMSDEDAELIRSVHRLHAKGLSYRKIAIELKISKSRAARLDRRWLDLHAFERRQHQAEIEDEEDEWEEGDDWEEDDLEGGDHDEDVTPCSTSDRDRYYGTSDDFVENVAVRGEMHGPQPAPFMYDRSDEAKRWQRFLIEKFPDRKDLEIVEGYAAGDAWCRPPGSKPPRDPKDPFAGLEVDVDVLGNVKYVEERYYDRKPSIYYAYGPNGRLMRFEREKMTPANPNLFGRYADVGKNGIRRGR